MGIFDRRHNYDGRWAYLRNTSVPLPDEFKEALPGFSSIKALVKYTSVEPESGHVTAIRTEISLMLLSGNDGQRRRYETIHEVPGPTVSPYGLGKVMNEAREMLRDPEYLARVLDAYVEFQRNP